MPVLHDRADRLTRVHAPLGRSVYTRSYMLVPSKDIMPHCKMACPTMMLSILIPATDVTGNTPHPLVHGAWLPLSSVRRRVLRSVPGPAVTETGVVQCALSLSSATPLEDFRCMSDGTVSSRKARASLHVPPCLARCTIRWGIRLQGSEQSEPGGRFAGAGDTGQSKLLVNNDAKLVQAKTGGQCTVSDFGCRKLPQFLRSAAVIGLETRRRTRA